MSHIVSEDLANVYARLGVEEKKKFAGSTVLTTGCAGFLGFYLLQFFVRYADELQIKRIIGLDNFMLRRPHWLDLLVRTSKKIEIREFDIIHEKIESVQRAWSSDYIVHMASIASPSFYRKYPLETLDANVWGLRNLLDFYKDKRIKGFLFLSSSEIYGDPPADCIPTDEGYRGNVASIGPRACYDEAKRFGETLCYLYARQFGMRVSIARPFNNYGPGMSLEDRRVPADFAKAVIENRDIEIYSDGSPTRTFCYISDAITGYLKVLTHGKFDYFNIGIEEPEISIRDLARIYVEVGQELFAYRGTARFSSPRETDYLTHNPNRRCPKIDKARDILQYRPAVPVDQGIRRFLTFLHAERGTL